MKNLGASETVSRLTTSKRRSGSCSSDFSATASEFVDSVAVATIRNAAKKEASATVLIIVVVSAVVSRNHCVLY
uniref:Uncharacterized protein n=1 Tax=Syphacia muris TaxID=451379 RepID=A0A0N5ACS6_9BILA